MKLGILTLILAGLPFVSSAATLINEFNPNPSGTDSATQVIELSGLANSTITDWWLVSIESDSVGSLGEIDSATQFSGVFNSSGLLQITIGDLENPSNVLFLADHTFSANIGDDLDVNNDGTLDSLSELGSVYDAIGVYDRVSDNLGYAQQLGGIDFVYTGGEPQLMFRDGVTQSWYAVNDPDNGVVYDSDGAVLEGSTFNQDPSLSTFGEINPTAVSAVPEPSTVTLFVAGMGLVGFMAMRRTKKVS